jgi:hypothetical protein
MTPIAEEVQSASLRIGFPQKYTEVSALGPITKWELSGLYTRAKSHEFGLESRTKPAAYTAAVATTCASSCSRFDCER